MQLRKLDMNTEGADSMCRKLHSGNRMAQSFVLSANVYSAPEEIGQGISGVTLG